MGKKTKKKYDKLEKIHKEFVTGQKRYFINMDVKQELNPLGDLGILYSELVKDKFGYPEVETRLDLSMINASNFKQVKTLMKDSLVDLWFYEPILEEIRMLEKYEATIDGYRNNLNGC